MSNRAGNLRFSPATSDASPYSRIESLSVLLQGGSVAADASTFRRADIEIARGRIQDNTGREPSFSVDLSGYRILPGLINAHDHLEFNLFPRLGSGPYPSYLDWASDIYRPDTPLLAEQLSVPKAVRLWWGGIKNLLSGVTTVSHHNPYEDEVFGRDFPVRVIRRYGWAHSLGFDEDVAFRFASTPDDLPFIIHLGEGTDARSADEIFELDRLHALDSRTVLVHAVGLTPDGQSLLKERGASIVWCPTSNRFTLGTTLNSNGFHGASRIALGSDSAMTAKGDLLDEIRAARFDENASPEAIYAMVTRSAARVLRLSGGEGTVAPGAVADLIAMRDRDARPSELLAQSDWRDVEMVLLAGIPQLLSEEMADRWPAEMLNDFEAMRIEGVFRLVRAPVRRLFDQARVRISGELRLAGKAIQV